MKNKNLKELKEIEKRYLENGDIQELQNSIKKLPPEIIELFNTMNNKKK